MSAGVNQEGKHILLLMASERNCYYAFHVVLFYVYNAVFLT